MTEQEQDQNQQQGSGNTKTIEVSEELYQAIDQLKQVIGQMTGKQIDSDEEVLGILVSGFIESAMGQEQGGGQGGEQGGQDQGGQGGGNSGIIT